MNIPIKYLPRSDFLWRHCESCNSHGLLSRVTQDGSMEDMDCPDCSILEPDRYTDIFGEDFVLLKLSDTGLMTLQRTRKDGSKPILFKYVMPLQINPEYTKYIELENIKRDKELAIANEASKKATLTQMASNVPKELSDIIASLKDDDLANQYRNGNTKAINSLVGKVLKQYKLANPSLVKQLLEDMLNE